MAVGRDARHADNQVGHLQDGRFAHYRINHDCVDDGGCHEQPGQAVPGQPSLIAEGGKPLHDLRPASRLETRDLGPHGQNHRPEHREASEREADLGDVRCGRRAGEGSMRDDQHHSSDGRVAVPPRDAVESTERPLDHAKQRCQDE
jgi:hypothetical protein